jgi:hypothetical protein
MITLLALTFVSCSRYDNAIHLLAGDDAALVTLTLAMPATPASRATVNGSVAENAISEIDALLFATNNNTDYYYYYRARAAAITPDPDPSTENENKKIFTVRLPFTPAGHTYRLVVLANAGAALSSFSPALAVGQVETSSSLSIDDALAPPDGVAATVSGKMPKTGFPMWGEVTGISIVDGGPAPSINIDLTRAVSRVDVIVGGGATADFTLSSVRLYNYSNTGFIAPGATSPTVPASAKTEGPLVYGTADGLTTAAIRESIYAFEANAGTGASTWKNNTCLVIGGHYKGSANEHYYRVEFATGSYPSYAYMPLLRNHLYEVTITAVSGPGWPSPADAYANLPENIKTTILPWNKDNMNNIVFDGQRYLSVDADRLDFHADGAARTLRVITDHPAAWSLDESTFPSWLEVVSTDPAAAAGALSALTIKADALSAGDPDREGSFYIVAGNLRKEITVKQVNAVEFQLLVTDPSTGLPLSELLFEPGYLNDPIVPRSFRVSWLPASLPDVSVSVATFTGTTPFDYATESPDSFTGSVSVPGTSGAVTFTVKPTVNSENAIRSTRLLFSVTLDGQTREYPLYLRQRSNTYAFSPDGATLALFSHFPHGTTLDGLNETNVPELADETAAKAVTKLAIEGNFAPTHISGIKGKQSSLLANLSAISLPDFAGTIPSGGWVQEGVLYQSQWLTSFEAPLLTGIGSHAFYECKNLTSVIIPSATTVERGAFRYCEKLALLDLPRATSIGTDGFRDCKGLTDLNAPLLTSTGDEVFRGCALLGTVHVPLLKTMGYGTFHDCAAMTTIELQEPTSLGNSMFQGCKSLTSAIIPNVKTFGQSAFRNCEKLLLADLPSATTIAADVFRTCKALTAVDAPLVTSIGQEAFEGCPALATARFGAVSSFGSRVFQGVKSDFSLAIDIPETSASIPGNMFGNNNIAAASGMTLYVPDPPATGATWGGVTWGAVKNYSLWPY